MRRVHASALLLLATGACGGHGPKVTLRYRPPAGAVYRYGLEQRTELRMESGPLAALGKQHILIRMYFTQTVRGPASGGGTEADVVFESMTMEMPGVRRDIQSELAKLRGMRATIVYDDRGQAIRSEFAASPGVSPDLVKQMQSGVSAMTFGFPDQPVGQGDSWTTTTELPLAQLPGTNAETAGPARTTLTIREIRIVGGGSEGSDTSVVVDISTTFPAGPIQLDIAGQRSTLTLDGVLKGHQQFSLTQGAILDGTIKGATTMNITSPLFGSQPMRMSSETESSISLLPEQ